VNTAFESHPGGLVVVYVSLHGPNTDAALHVLQRGGCSPVTLDNPNGPNLFPHLGITYRIRIAVPVEEAELAAGALLQWRHENEWRQTKFRTEMRAWFLRVGVAALLAGIIPLLILVLVSLAQDEVLDAAWFLSALLWIFSFALLLTALRRSARWGSDRPAWWVPVAWVVGLVTGIGIRQRGGPWPYDEESSHLHPPPEDLRAGVAARKKTGDSAQAP